MSSVIKTNIGFILLFLLCIINRKNALKRGRNPIIFIALTIIIWYALPFIGGLIYAHISIRIDHQVPITISIIMLVLRILISYYITKHCKPGNYNNSSAHALKNIEQDLQMLTNPATLTIICENTAEEAGKSYQLFLNGTEITTIENGETLSLSIPKKMNTLKITDPSGSEISPLVFELSDGASAEVCFINNVLLPKFTVVSK